jgi:type IV fimbrial biogenesis protein FimT
MRALHLRRASRGFTAVELMIVVVIVAILTAMAAPWMAHMVRAQRLRTASFDMNTSLQLARSEAIKRNVSVTVAPNSGNWAAGWVIQDANGTVLKRQEAFDTLGITGPANVAFTGSGRVSAGTGVFTITTDLGGDLGVKCRFVTVDLSGRAVSKEAPC